MRCKREKAGVHPVIIFGLPYDVCNRCASRIINLKDLWTHSKNDQYKLKLEKLMFHAVGFNEL